MSKTDTQENNQIKYKRSKYAKQSSIEPNIEVRMKYISIIQRTKRKNECFLFLPFSLIISLNPILTKYLKILCSPNHLVKMSIDYYSMEHLRSVSLIHYQSINELILFHINTSFIIENKIRWNILFFKKYFIVIKKKRHFNAQPSYKLNHLNTPPVWKQKL